MDAHVAQSRASARTSVSAGNGDPALWTATMASASRSSGLPHLGGGHQEPSALLGGADAADVYRIVHGPWGSRPDSGPAPIDAVFARLARGRRGR